MASMPQRRSPRPSPRSSSRRPPAVQTYRRRRPRRRFPWVQALVLAVVVVLIAWLAYGALASPKRAEQPKALGSASKSATSTSGSQKGAAKPKPKRLGVGIGQRRPSRQRCLAPLVPGRREAKLVGHRPRSVAPVTDLADEDRVGTHAAQGRQQDRVLVGDGLDRPADGGAGQGNRLAADRRLRPQPAQDRDEDGPHRVGIVVARRDEGHEHRRRQPEAHVRGEPDHRGVGFSAGFGAERRRQADRSAARRLLRDRQGALAAARPEDAPTTARTSTRARFGTKACSTRPWSRATCTRSTRSRRAW